MHMPAPPVLMRSKNIHQLTWMVAEAARSSTNTYRETRGNHVFCVTRRMPTRAFPHEFQCTTTLRIGHTLHVRTEYIPTSPEEDSVPSK